MLKDMVDEGYKVLRSVNNLKAVLASIKKLDTRDVLYRIYNVIVGRRIASKLWVRKDRGLSSAIILALAAFGAIFLAKQIEDNDDEE